jgi:hypothetical protein
MITWAIIRNEHGVGIAVVLHDTEAKRIVYKVRPGDALLHKALDILVDRDVVVLEDNPLLGCVQRRVVQLDDEKYLPHFLDRAVQHPYTVTWMEKVESEGRLDIDDLADSLHADHVAG